MFAPARQEGIRLSADRLAVGAPPAQERWEGPPHRQPRALGDSPVPRHLHSRRASVSPAVSALTGQTVPLMDSPSQRVGPDIKSAPASEVRYTGECSGQHFPMTQTCCLVLNFLIDSDATFSCLGKMAPPFSRTSEQGVAVGLDEIPLSVPSPRLCKSKAAKESSPRTFQSADVPPCNLVHQARQGALVYWIMLDPSPGVPCPIQSIFSLLRVPDDRGRSPTPAAWILFDIRIPTTNSMCPPVPLSPSMRPRSRLSTPLPGGCRAFSNGWREC